MTIKEQILGIMDALDTMNCQVDNYDILATAIALWLRADSDIVKNLTEKELTDVVEKMDNDFSLMSNEGRYIIDEFLEGFEEYK